MGKFHLVSKNKSCVTSFIDRTNIEIKEMNLVNDSTSSIKIFVDEINNVDYQM